jgi:hypothetical protein
MEIEATDTPIVSELNTPIIESVTTNPENILLWVADFDTGLEGFTKTVVDPGVACSNSRSSDEDIFTHVVYDELVPSDSGMALEVIANVNKRPGVFINNITVREVYNPLPPWKKFNATVHGYFRSLNAETGEERAEVLDFNLSLVINYGEFPGEVGWKLNPGDSTVAYEFIYIKEVFGESNEFRLRPLFRLPHDNSWHEFAVTYGYDLSDATNPLARFVSVRIDNIQQLVDAPIQYNRNNKDWENSFEFLVETQNAYTGCQTSAITYGVSRWAEISIVITPLK